MERSVSLGLIPLSVKCMKFFRHDNLLLGLEGYIQTTDD